jgi:hypothetical protein
MQMQTPQTTQTTTQTTDGATTQRMDNNADNYAATQTTFVNNVADYDADAMTQTTL